MFVKPVFRSINTGALRLAGALAVAALPSTAPAATIVVTATGNVANTTFGTFSIGNSAFRTGTLTLDQITPFQIRRGDVIQLSVLLTGLLAGQPGIFVPASGEQLFGVNFFNGPDGSPGFGLGDTTNSGTTTFSFSFGPTGRRDGNVAGSGCGNCLSAISGQSFAPGFRFDGIELLESIDNLPDADSPFTVDNITISYQLRDIAGGVPEPATWGMLILGFGVAGAAMRRRAAARPAIA